MVDIPWILPYSADRSWESREKSFQYNFEIDNKKEQCENLHSCLSLISDVFAKRFKIHEIGSWKHFSEHKSNHPSNKCNSKLMVPSLENSSCWSKSCLFGWTWSLLWSVWLFRSFYNRQRKPVSWYWVQQFKNQGFFKS